MSSRHSTSSKSKSGHKGMDSASEDALAQCKSAVNSLSEIRSYPSYLDAYLASARSAMNALDRIHFFRENHRLAEQLWLLNGLQDFAFHEGDIGFIKDIADWCQAGWLRVLRNYPDNVETLTGLGYNWFQRSQAIVGRITDQERNDSSSQGSSNNSGSPLLWSLLDDNAYYDTASPPADPRRQGPMYVEAQSYLQPAADFYASAVRHADLLGTINGRLLTSAAEAYMSLGQVTGPPNDLRNFSHAVRYLRRAEQIPGYYLSSGDQQFLEQWGRYVT